MRALDVKLWRDLLRLRAQSLAVGAVLACGVGGFVGEFSTHLSLKGSRDAYYEASRFADVFAGVRRAPLALRERLQAIDGVAEVKLETSFDTQLDLAGVTQPVSGRFIGLDLARAPTLNLLTLRAGRMPARSAQLEAVVNERFAEVRGLRPGATLVALLNGRRETVHVVGTVVSPEYVYATRGGEPDDQWFGVLWVDGERLAAAFDMQGAFNRASMRLDAGARVEAVIEATDRLLQPWGSIGAVARADQLSNAIVDNELKEQQVLGTVLPAIFLAVASFILNGVLGRQVALQRPQIAALKALGYADRTIAWHYVRLALAMAAAGTVAGLLLSLFLGRAMLAMYAEVFRFAGLAYRTDPLLVAVALAAVAAAAALGAFGAVRSVLALSPAQAMQPPAPPHYRATLIERLGVARRAAPAALMVLRNLERRPLRALLTIGGVAAAVALQISGAFWLDAIDHIVDVQFRQVQQGDVDVDFSQAVAPGVGSELLRLPGVLEVQPYRSEPVRVRAGGAPVDTLLTGHPPGGRLLRVVDEERGALALPPDGAVLSALLARELGVRRGDTIEVEFRLGHRRRARVAVADIAHTMFGKTLTMSLAAMNRLAGDGMLVNQASLRIDPNRFDDFHAALKQAPRVSAVFDKSGVLQSFEQTTARNLGFFTRVLTLFAMVMAAGITYNAARIALSERAWELASLRVLGMTRAEVSWLLLAELALEVLVALPLGGVAGFGLASGLMALMRSENIDFPVVIEPATYAVAALSVLVAAAVSALAVRRRIDRLDLVAVLKVRE